MATKVRGQGYTVQVRGLEALLRATDRAGGDIKRNTRNALREAAEPVRREAEGRLVDRYGADYIRVGVSVRRTGVVAVEQRLRRTTGTRRDFGTRQMQKGFLPALADNAESTQRLLGDAVDKTLRDWSRL